MALEKVLPARPPKGTKLFWETGKPAGRLDSFDDTGETTVVLVLMPFGTLIPFRPGRLYYDA